MHIRRELLELLDRDAILQGPQRHVPPGPADPQQRVRRRHRRRDGLLRLPGRRSQGHELPGRVPHARRQPGRPLVKGQGKVRHADLLLPDVAHQQADRQEHDAD